MRRLILSSFVLLLLIAIGCKTKLTGPEPPVIYSGITNTGPDSPDPIGNIDPDDWYYPKDSTAQAYFYVRPAFPNPTGGWATLRYNLPTDETVKIWLDDPILKRTTILVNTLKRAGNYSISIDPSYHDSTLSHTRPDGIFRLFIQVTSNTKYPIVHGDILYISSKIRF